MSASVHLKQVDQKWTQEETKKILVAGLKIQEIQKRIDEYVRVLFHSPQIIAVCPLLEKYKSTFRQITFKAKPPVSENLMLLESILADAQRGILDEEKLKKLQKIFTQLNEIDLDSISPLSLYQWVQFLSRGIEYSKVPAIREILKRPEFLQSVWRIAAMPEGPEAAMSERLKDYEDLEKAFTQLILASGQILYQYLMFLSPIDLIFAKVSAFFILKKEGIEPPLEEAMRAIFTDPEKILKKIIRSQAHEKLALSLLNENDPEKLRKVSRNLVNNMSIEKLPVAAQLVILKTLAETDGILRGNFKQKTLTLVDSILEISLDKLKV